MVNLEQRRITLVTAPIDMRFGIKRLKSFCQSILNINLDECKDCVVFIYRDHKSLKMLLNDYHGTFLGHQRLNNHLSFKKVLTRCHEKALFSLSKKELISYINGNPIQIAHNKI